MCLLLYCQEKNTTKFVKTKQGTPFANKLKKSKSGKVICWKTYIKCKTHLISVWRGCIVAGAGVVKSDRIEQKLNLDEKINGEVRRGIHVFTYKPIATYADVAVVPVVCDKADLIAQGDNRQAVFMKVKIGKTTWNKIFPKK